MADVPQASAFNWATAIMAWAGAFIIALVAGIFTYLATIKAGRQQAIETEKLRIRFGILQRRVEGFDQASRAFQEFMHENPVTTSLHLYAQHDFRDLAVALVSAAGIIDTSGLQPTRLMGPADQFNDACLAMADVAIEAVQPKCGSTQTNEDAFQRIKESTAAAWVDIQSTLLHLQSAVDEATEERLRGMA